MDNPFNYLFPSDDPMHDFDPFSEENNGLVKWVNDASGYWGSDRGQYEFQSILYSLSGGLLAHEEKMREMDEALKRYGLEWSDIKYKWKTLGFDNAYGNAVSRGMNYIGRNIDRLYR